MNLLIVLFACFQWVELVTRSMKSSSGNKSLTGVLLANKTDLANRRRISPKVGSELAQQLGFMYFEGSCKEYKGVEEPFYYLANEWHKQHVEKSESMARLA